MKYILPKSAHGKKIVVIVGAGFAGLNAAKVLAKKPSVHVILIDQKNHHLFQPLLYQVATAGLNPADIAVPIRGEFSGISNVEVHMDQIASVNTTQQCITSLHSELEIGYDFLVLACGASHSYFGHPEWEEFAPGLKTLEQATEIRRRIFSAFEKAESETDPERFKQPLNFVVVGGGPTGVELAGAIAEICKKVLIRDFRRIDTTQAHILLLEAGPRVLPMFSEDLSAKAHKNLEDLSVEVRCSLPVQNIDEHGAHTKEGCIESRSIFWAAGNEARTLQINATHAPEQDRAGRIKVNHDLSIPQLANVFVIGDMAHVAIDDDNSDNAESKTVPSLAPAAIQQGTYIAKTILAQIRSVQHDDFTYTDKGITATIGKNKAVLETGKFKLTGRLAWLAWLFIHIFYLIGFKNRFSVILYWAWNYIFSKRGVRIITDKN